MNSLTLLLSILISQSSYAYIENDNLDKFAGHSEMNGYKYSKFAGFDKRWKLVAVRYRVDTNEMRFTYANPIAWKSMLEGKVDYPDGSVFGKVGFITEDDPSFTSSRVASGARRYQFMVRDKKKHSTTNGWGYALFDAQGKTFPEDPILKTQACAACHNIVPERGYVFSQPMEPNLFIKSIRAQGSSLNKFEFSKVKINEANDRLKKYLGEEKYVYLLEGKLRNYLFQGTLDEIRPLLMDEAKKNQSAVALANNDFTRFTLVQLIKNDCPTGQMKYAITQTQYEKDDKNNFKVKTEQVCK